MSKLQQEIEQHLDLTQRAIRSKATDTIKVLRNVEVFLKRVKIEVAALEKNQKGSPGRPRVHPRPPIDLGVEPRDEH